MQIQQGFVRRSWVAGSLALTLILAPVTIPRRADGAAALVALGTGGALSGVALAMVMSVASGACSAYFYEVSLASKRRADRFWARLYAVGFGVGAIYLLDDSDARSGEFKSLDSAQAVSSGLTQLEWSSYEQDLEFINSLREEVMVRANRKYPAGSLTSLAAYEAWVAQIQASWLELASGTVAPETLSAIRKLGSRMYAESLN